MGGFYNSFHVWRKTQAEVCELIKSLKDEDRGKCIVAPESNQWTAVYAELEYTYPLAIIISEQLQTTVLWIDIHDDDVFCYELFKNGESIDEFNSCPDYFGTASPEDNINAFSQFTKEKLDAFNEQLITIAESATAEFQQCKNKEGGIEALIKKVEESKKELYQQAGLDVKSNENDPRIDHTECFAEYLNDPKDVSKLAELLESMRKFESVIVSMPAGEFCDALKLTDAINSYDYLLEEELPEGYVHINE
jgi:hypothetical protein